MSLSKWGIGALWSEGFVIVTVPLLLNVLVSASWTTIRRREHWKSQYFVIFVPLLAFPAIAFIGAIAWRSGVPVPPLFRPEPNVIAAWAVNILDIAAIVIGIVMIFKMKRLRWLSMSIFLFIQWMLQLIGFIVNMPIGGVWL